MPIGRFRLQSARPSVVSVAMPLVRHRLFHKQTVPRRRVRVKQPPSLWRDGPIRTGYLAGLDALRHESAAGDGLLPGPCLQGSCKIRSDAYACVFRLGFLSVPSEKSVPIHPRRTAPPHPQSMQCWLPAEPNWGQVSRCEKSFPSCLRRVLRSRQHCMGGAGWPQPRDGLG